MDGCENLFLNDTPVNISEQTHDSGDVFHYVVHTLMTWVIIGVDGAGMFDGGGQRTELVSSPLPLQRLINSTRVLDLLSLRVALGVLVNSPCALFSFWLTWLINTEKTWEVHGPGFFFSSFCHRINQSGQFYPPIIVQYTIN